MARLTGKVTVITGASKGIGAGIATRFAIEGASVIVTIRRIGKEQSVSE